MLKNLQIQNFKGWSDTGAIRMAPISLFFGTNSSGKSSIGQFLMLLKQTAESSDRKAVFNFGDRNSAVQLGSYQDVVFQRNPKNKIRFNYEWSLPSEMRFLEWTPEDFGDDYDYQALYKVDKINFDAKVGLENTDQQKLVVDKFQYVLKHQNEESMSIDMKRTNGSKPKYKVNARDEDGFYLKPHKGRIREPESTVRFYGFPDEVVAYHQNAEFLHGLNLQHEDFFRSIFYLGPLRIKAERLYTWAGNDPESVGYTGENTVAAVLAARDRKISFGRKKWGVSLKEIIAMKLKEMGLIEEFKVSQIAKQRRQYEVKVCAKGSSDMVDLPDVGFGISQVLPVLVQCFYAPTNSIIIMEQPELHLHPSAQAALADVMIDVINSRENGNNRGIQLIIETHSEHFLRRLQRRIAEGKIPQEKVSAYFANVNATPAKLEPLEIDVDGNIQNWPEDFFGDTFGDMLLQAKAAQENIMARKGGSK